MVDVSQKSGTALRTVAKGAVITAMTTQSKTANVDPVVASAEVTDPGTDPDPGANSFPSQLQSVTTQTAPDGTRQQLVLVPGRFLASADGTAGTQELMTGLHVSVLYSSGTDYTAPTQQASATITGTTAKFTVQTTGGAGRVAVLWNQANTATWQDAELTDPGATGTFTGSVTLTATGGPLQFFSQAVDPSGNVSVASGKGAGLVSSTPSTYAFATTGPSTPSGWFNGPATLTVASSQPSVPFDISVDGAAPQPYIGPIVIGAEGTHAVSITGSDGGQATTTVKVDSKLPTVGFATMPPTNTTFNVGAAVPIAYQCADAVPGSGIASCTGPTLPASLDTATPTAPGVPRVLTVIAKDAAGHTVTGTYRYSVVQTVVPGAPVVNAGPDLNYGVGTQRTISASFTDALPGGGPYTYRLDPGDGRGYSLPVTKTKAGAITVKVTYAKVGTFTASLTVCDATSRCGTDRLVLSSHALVRTACVVAPAKATQPWKTTITVTNSNTAAVAVALGTSNVMTNATASPATKFPVGAKTFSYTFTNSAQPLTWTLLGAVLTVRTTGPRC